MSLCEETLNAGYFPATISQTLQGTYEVVRKLGCGRRSSVWLVLDIHTNKYFALKIFTVAASQRGELQELPMLEAAKIPNSPCPHGIPWPHGSFWEKSGQGDHFCILETPLSTSVQDLLQASERQRLPIDAVRMIVYSVALILSGLHGSTIMHGGKLQVRRSLTIDSPIIRCESR